MLKSKLVAKLNEIEGDFEVMFIPSGNCREQQGEIERVKLWEYSKTTMIIRLC